MNTTPNAPISDDELGAALGASVRTRVDDVPTITPSFDGVERRARQITQRRRATAGLAIGALIVFGGIGLSVLAGDDEGADIDDVVTEPEPEPDAEEVVVVDAEDRVTFDFDLDEVEVTALVDDSTRFIANTRAGHLTLVEVSEDRRIVTAIALADQTLVWGESSASPGLWQEVWLKRPGSEPELILQGHRLNGAATVDGVPYAFVSDTRANDPALERVNLLDLTREILTTADDGTTFFPVDIRADLLIVPTFSSVGGEWRYVWLDGTPAYNDVRFAPREDSGITRWSVRFGHDDSNIWWLESNAETTEWALVNGTEVGVELQRVELDAGIDDAVLMSLEITDGQMAINLLQAGATPLAFDTIWVDPADLSTTVGHDEGAVNFIEQEAPSGGLLTRSPANVDISELGVTMLNDINERDWTVDDFGRVPIDMAGLDENGVVWVVSPAPEPGQTILFDRWQSEEATDVRWVEGGVLLQVGSTVVDLNWYADEFGHRVTGNGRLVGATTIGTDRYGFIVDGDTDDLLMVDLRRGESRVVLAAADLLAGRVENVHVGGEVILVEVHTGNQPFFLYVDLFDDGSSSTPGRSADDLASPTDGRYGFEWGGPDFVQVGRVHGATLSADATTLYWIEEGPIDAASFEPTLELHAMSTGSGAEAPVVLLTLPATQVRLDYGLALAGDGLLLTRSWEPQQYAAPIVIDPVAGTWAELDLPAGPWAPLS